MRLDCLLASQNDHKRREFADLFSADVLQITTAPISLKVEETGQTYQENAFLKAEAYYQKYRQPVMADDSGLDVESLVGELGVYSARFGGPGLSDDQRCDLLLEKLRHQEQRKASFTCVLCFYLSPQEVFFFEGRLRGHIDRAKRGEGGFGYDPVFIPEGRETQQTLAEIPQWKKQFSHRSLACAFAEKFFLERTKSRGEGSGKV